MFFTAKTQRNESALVPRVRRVVNHGGCHRGHRGHRDHSRKVSFNEIGSRPLNDHWLLVPRSPGVIVNCFSPYPRSPLREFTPCAPGRSTSSCQEANPIRYRNYPPHPKIGLPVARCSLLVGAPGIVECDSSAIFSRCSQAIASILQKRSQPPLQLQHVIAPCISRATGLHFKQWK